MIDIVFDQEAIDFLKKLPKPLKERIFDKIIAAKQNPFHFFKRLVGRTDFRMRVGDYRIIADITPDRIEVTLIGHRKNIYGQ